MSFLVYFFVLLVAASSVLFGLDWMQAPLQPPSYGQRTVHAAAPPVAPVVPVKIVADAKPVAPADAKPFTSATLATSSTAASVSDPVTTGAASTLAPADSIDAFKQAGEPSTAPTMESQAEAKPPLCDIAACERAYHTFTPADCTYKPYEGPRRLCSKGNPPGRGAALLAANESRAQAHCNVSACESAYSSFDAGSCTYQPYDGPRRLCTK